ncbi:MAG TPA: hypothetical protein PKM25_19175, partial [Candidatus Ozemobacteraceae bacterium]|nr:hypothetical protein [Candidatus Ozemobacteraceae bacterium]
MIRLTRHGTKVLLLIIQLILCGPLAAWEAPVRPASAEPCGVKAASPSVMAAGAPGNKDGETAIVGAWV